MRPKKYALSHTIGGKRQQLKQRSKEVRVNDFFSTARENLLHSKLMLAVLLPLSTQKRSWWSEINVQHDNVVNLIWVLSLYLEAELCKADYNFHHSTKVKLKLSRRGRTCNLFFFLFLTILPLSLREASRMARSYLYNYFPSCHVSSLGLVFFSSLST